ncbi:hypothetical protein QUW02_11905, partial [Bacteroides eggerthii]|nr:hypothetical protein [Bacteroides eggerthii]
YGHFIRKFGYIAIFCYKEGILTHPLYTEIHTRFPQIQCASYPKVPWWFRSMTVVTLSKHQHNLKTRSENPVFRFIFISFHQRELQDFSLQKADN